MGSGSIIAEREQVAGPSSELAGAASPGTGADRAFLLECRLEQLRAALDEARAEADRARTRLAESAAREADHARRHGLLHEELATAREEVASLHRRLEHSEALRAGVEGRLFESTSTDDAHELIRLQSEVVMARQGATAQRQTVADLRARVEKLVASRETLLTRVVEWQRRMREGDPDAIDLAEFIAALRHDILELEHRNAVGEQREAELREQVRRAVMKVESDVPPPAAPSAEAAPEGGGEALVTRLAAAADAETRINVLLRLGRSGSEEAFYAIRTWLGAPEPQVRAAAYQALGRLLERDPARLEPHVRWGIADGDPRVRRRVVLAAATAHGLGLRPLLEPLRCDPDPQVRRVVQEVLRGTSPAAAGAEVDAAAGTGDLDSEEVRSGIAS